MKSGSTADLIALKKLSHPAYSESSESHGCTALWSAEAAVSGSPVALFGMNLSCYVIELCSKRSSLIRVNLIFREEDLNLTFNVDVRDYFSAA